VDIAPTDDFPLPANMDIKDKEQLSEKLGNRNFEWHTRAHECTRACMPRKIARICTYLHANVSSMVTMRVPRETQAGRLMSCITFFAFCFDQRQNNNHVTCSQPIIFMGGTLKTAVQLLPTQKINC